MRLTVHLDSNANTEVKVLGENDTLMIIGGDEISTTDGMGSYYIKPYWFFKALNYSTILKSELELQRGSVYEKVKLVNLNKEEDNLEIPTVKIYPDCIFSSHIKTFLQHLEYESKRCKKHPIKLISINKWVSDSLTYDKVATMLFKNYEKFAKSYPIYILIEDTQESIIWDDGFSKRPRRMNKHEYYQFKMFNNLNIKSYEI
jgi:hypothetical protein|tara:strand:- start:1014 stop:1619 length:606 start_codon:yes stop_codon:yes gene_type:complete